MTIGIEISRLNPNVEEFKSKWAATVTQMKIQGIQQEDKKIWLFLWNTWNSFVAMKDMAKSPWNHSQLACKKICRRHDKAATTGLSTQTVEHTCLHKQ